MRKTGSFLHQGRHACPDVKARSIGVWLPRELCGHANVATTAGYCWVSDEQLANAVNVFLKMLDSVVKQLRHFFRKNRLRMFYAVI
jgi:hypothetical protein